MTLAGTSRDLNRRRRGHWVNFANLRPGLSRAALTLISSAAPDKNLFDPNKRKIAALERIFQYNLYSPPGCDCVGGLANPAPQETEPVYQSSHG